MMLMLFNSKTVLFIITKHLIILLIIIIMNKTKVLSVQLRKTLGLNKVPFTETEESSQVRKKNLI